MSSVNSFETDMKKLRRRKKGKRILKNTLFIFVVIVVALLVYATRSVWISFFDGILEKAQNSGYAPDELEGPLAEGNYPLDVSKKNNTAINSMSKCWTLLADNTFYVYDGSGESVYTAQMNYTNPIVKCNDKRTLVYDLGGYSFTVLSNKKQIYSKDLTDQILLGSVGMDGTVALVTTNDKYTSYLTVYDKNGSEIFHWTDSNMITAVNVNEKGTGCIVASMYARDGEFKSVLSVIDFSSTQLVMKSSPISSMVFGLEYCQNGDYWLVCNNALYRMSQDGTLAYSYPYKYDLADYSADDKVVALAFESVADRYTTVALFGYNSADAYEMSIDDDVNCVVVDGSTVYLNTDDAVLAVDRNGNTLFEMQLDSVCKQFCVSDGNIYLLGYKYVDKIEIVY